MCYKRGFEIIFPYQEGIFKIKKETNISPDQKRAELNKFKNQFEKNFQGIPFTKRQVVPMQGCLNIWSVLSQLMVKTVKFITRK